MQYQHANLMHQRHYSNFNQSKTSRRDILKKTCWLSWSSSKSTDSPLDPPAPHPPLDLSSYKLQKYCLPTKPWNVSNAISFWVMLGTLLWGQSARLTAVWWSSVCVHVCGRVCVYKCLPCVFAIIIVSKELISTIFFLFMYHSFLSFSVAGEGNKWDVAMQVLKE